LARGHDVAAQAERTEAEAWSQLQLALPADLKAELGARVHRHGAAALLATPGADVAMLNRAIGLGFDRPLDASQLATIREWFTSAGVKRWLLEWSPEARPANAGELLARSGGVLRTPTIKLYCELDDVPAAQRKHELTIGEIGPSDAEQFQATVAEPLGVPHLVAPGIRSTLGEPGWHFYLACDAERPIAGAALFVSGHGAWLGVAATSAQARNRGAQTALLHRRLADAKGLGCRWASAETRLPTDENPNPSLRNMLRAGLKVLYHRPKYLFGEIPSDAAPPPAPSER
jgi:GNAT superfamily N-acetyltransferase